MKINIQNLSLQLSHSDKPFNFFLYVPNCPFFVDADHEHEWIERAKLYMFQQIQNNPALCKGQYHYVYLPDAIMNTPNNDHIFTPSDYDEGWCMIVYHPLPRNDTFDDLMHHINIPHHCACILIPNVQEYIHSSYQHDLIDSVLKRFLFLLGIFIMTCACIYVVQK